MTPERWRQVEEIFHATLARGESDRAGFLAEACAGDAELLREVKSLLSQPTSVRGFLDGPAMAAAALGAGETGPSTLTDRRLGPYHLHEPIGAGGMGEVYRARDTKLGRDVAIKILPRHFTSDPERLARFEREARILASLNHPHIGAIYGLEDVDGVRALVLELVGGETLADRIARGPIPVNDTLTIARQIADALEAAHEKGIVHRDLKPANIKITPDGVVKVLDFGLAKMAASDAVAADPAQSPTLTVGGTKEGVILGTATYMSPEQARGRPADKRADVWAFGVVLYEMLTGRRAFEGEAISEVLAKVIEREPDWTALPASTPARLRDLLRRCVRKDPKTRLQAIGDARVQIEELISGATEEPPRSSPHSRAYSVVRGSHGASRRCCSSSRRRWQFPPPVLLSSCTRSGLTRFEIATPPTSDPVSFALSADGRQLAFVATAEGTSRLWVRPLDQVTARPLAGTEGARYPFWRPDGRAIGFFADGKLKWIELGSNVLHVPADAPNGRGGTWNSEDVIVFNPNGVGVLLRVMAAGGTPMPVTQLPSDQGSHRFPQFLPDGRHFLFLGGTGQADEQDMFVGTIDGGESKRVRAARSVAVFAAPASLLWVEEGVLVAQRFDPALGVVSGEPIPVVQDVGLDEAVYRGMFAVSATGVLAHRTGRGERRQLTWVDRAGIARGTVGPPDEAGLSGS